MAGYDTIMRLGKGGRERAGNVHTQPLRHFPGVARVPYVREGRDPRGDYSRVDERFSWRSRRRNWTNGAHALLHGVESNAEFCGDQVSEYADDTIDGAECLEERERADIRHTISSTRRKKAGVSRA